MEQPPTIPKSILDEVMDEMFQNIAASSDFPESLLLELRRMADAKEFTKTTRLTDAIRKFGGRSDEAARA